MKKILNNKIDIMIKPVAGKKGDFLSYYHSDLLQATFSCYFSDNIMGSVAVNHFSQMIRFRYGKDYVDFTLSDKEITFSNPAILDLFCGMKKGVLK